jgi:hypothetical protein
MQTAVAARVRLRRAMVAAVVPVSLIAGLLLLGMAAATPSLARDRKSVV